MHPAFGNKVVMAGYYHEKGGVSIADYVYPGAFYSSNFPVGHNLKFDYGFVAQKHPTSVMSLLAFDTPVWDTQVAEYVNGNGLLSLEKACEKHGVAFKKDEEIKAYWEQGYDTEDIPKEMLREYLEGDVRATHALFRKQWGAYKNKQLIKDMSRASIALAWMEQEGMYVNEDVLLAYADELFKEQRSLETVVANSLLSRGWPEDEEFKYNSAAHMQLLFFGGTLTREERQLVGKYKNGKDKYKKVPVEYVIGVPKNSGELQAPGRTPSGKAKFDDNWFTNNTGIVSEVDSVYRIRAIKKEVSTFIDGIAANRNGDTGLLHGDFNHCLTKTGRLSSSNPNLQNLTNQSTLKKVFTSRYGSNLGHIVEIDYSQLEVAVLACLSGDPVLLKDIREGNDLHYETGKSVFGWKTAAESKADKNTRRIVKAVNFGLIYGGGAATISRQTGAPEALCQRLIDAFFARYPGVRKWQKANMQLLDSNSTWTSATTDSGQPAKTGQLVSPLGRVWKFTQEDPPWGGEPNFSPTKVKNYPVQGFATGDLVPIAVMLVAKHLAKHKLHSEHLRVHLTSTVHDSIILDVGYGELATTQVAKEIADVMSKGLQEYIKDNYGVELPVELKAEPSYGPNWYEQKEI